MNIERLIDYSARLIATHPALACTLLDDVVRAHPRNGGAWATHALALAKCERIPDARASLAHALALIPNDIELICMSADLAMAALDYAAMARAIEACIALDPPAEHPAGIRARALAVRAKKVLKHALEVRS